MPILGSKIFMIKDLSNKGSEEKHKQNREENENLF